MHYNYGLDCLLLGMPEGYLDDEQGRYADVAVRRLHLATSSLSPIRRSEG